jgi:GAF domain-containing protein
MAEIGKVRPILGVRMQRERMLIGVVALAGGRVELFTHKQVELVTTFADQAVIAIENARLFEEVQQRTRELSRSVAELKALSEVSKAVYASLDLQTVLNTILAHACDISDSDGGAIYLFDEARSAFVLETGRNMSDELIAAVRAHPIRLGDALVGECAERREAVQIENLSKVPPHPPFEMHLKASARCSRCHCCIRMRWSALSSCAASASAPSLRRGVRVATEQKVGFRRPPGRDSGS